MSQQRRFEGPDVRALLDEICTTYGTEEPTISRAETFRTGGVLGFFQRECYRLVVDEPALPAAPTATAATAAATAPTAATAATAPTVGTAPAAVTTTQLPEVTPASVVAAYSEAAMTPVASSEELTAAEFLDGVATPGDDSGLCWGTRAVDPFASVADSAMDDTVVLSTARMAPALPAIKPLPAIQPLPPLPAEDWEPPVMDALPSFDEILRRVAQAVEAPITPHIEAEPVEWPRVDKSGAYVPAHFATAKASDPVVESDQIVAVPDGRTASDYRRTSVDGETSAFNPPVDTLAAGEPVPVRASLADRIAGPIAVEPASPVAGRPVDGGLIDRLARLGLPSSVAGSIERTASEGWSVEASILNAMADLPSAAAPALTAGSVVVVIGPAGRADAEAMRMAAELGEERTHIGFIRSSAGASEFVAERPSDLISVLAVEAPAGARSTVLAWARRLMDELQPELVVAVVDAMYKNDDLAAWITTLGGVDTLVVDHIESTSSPAGILELGLPVGRLGEQAATPARWAATIADRLADAGHADTLDPIDSASAATADRRLDAEVG